MMKTFIIRSLGILTFIALTASASAQLGDFGRQWKNVKRNSSGISKLAIDVGATNGADILVSAFGKCSPTDCEWGNAPALAYGPNVSAELLREASNMIAEYDFGFVEVRMIISRVSRRLIKVESFSHFKDGSGRTDYHEVELMRPLRKNEQF